MTHRFLPPSTPIDDCDQLRLALQRVQIRYAPDERVEVFDLHAEGTSLTPTISGAVSDNHLQRTGEKEKIARFEGLAPKSAF